MADLVLDRQMSVPAVLEFAFAAIWHPRSAARWLAARDDANRIGWQLVIFYMVVGLATAVALEWLVNRWELELILTGRDYAMLVLAGLLFMPVSYWAFRWLLHRVFGYGENSRDPRLCSVAALPSGIAIYLDCLFAVIQGGLYFAVARYAESPSGTYDVVSIWAVVPVFMIYVVYQATFFSEVWDIGFAKALWPIFSVMAIMVVAFCAVYFGLWFAIELLSPGYSE